MNESGWIKLHRKILTSGLNGTMELNTAFCLACYLLLNAKYSDDEYKIYKNNRWQKLKEGQLTTSKTALILYLGCSYPTLKRITKILEDADFIKTEEFGKKGEMRTLFTVCNYEKYQDKSNTRQYSLVQTEFNESSNEVQMKFNESSNEAQTKLNESSPSYYQEGKKKEGKKVRKKKGSKSPKVDLAPAIKMPSDGSLVWDSYHDAYLSRYGIEPPRNAQANSLCKQLVDRVGVESAIKLVEFYLTHMSEFYVSKCHQLRFCVADAEKLYTEMLKGVKMTRGTAQEINKEQERDAQWQRIVAMRKKTND